MALGRAREAANKGLEVPVVLVVVALFVLMAFETGQAIHDRRALSDLRRSQEPTVQEAIKVRQQLDTLARKTAQLSAGGDEGVRSVVAQIKRQGVSLNPPKP